MFLIIWSIYNALFTKVLSIHDYDNPQTDLANSVHGLDHNSSIYKESNR